MAINTSKKEEIVSEYGSHKTDTGSVDVQAAILTARINDLQVHFSKEKKDHHSRRGLLKLVGQRKRLLEYKKRKDVQGYRDLIKRLGLRK